MSQIQKVVLGCLGVLSVVTCVLFAVITLTIGTYEELLRADSVQSRAVVHIGTAWGTDLSVSPKVLQATATMSAAGVPQRMITASHTPTRSPAPTATARPSPTITRAVPTAPVVSPTPVPTRTPTRALRATRAKPSPTATPAIGVLPNKSDHAGIIVGAPYEGAESETVKAINELREQSQVAPLGRDPVLDLVARERSMDMATRSYFSHEDPAGGPLPLEKALLGQRVQYRQAGENIAYFLGPTTADLLPELAAAKWAASPPHRENIAEPAYNLTGFGIASVETDEGTMWYLTQVFVQR